MAFCAVTLLLITDEYFIWWVTGNTRHHSGASTAARDLRKVEAKVSCIWPRSIFVFLVSIGIVNGFHGCAKGFRPFQGVSNA